MDEPYSKKIGEKDFTLRFYEEDGRQYCVISVWAGGFSSRDNKYTVELVGDEYHSNWVHRDIPLHGAIKQFVDDSHGDWVLRRTLLGGS